jgi:3-methyladenine DNA glycosylase/8-oxoguanine DNA glycosylase
MKRTFRVVGPLELGLTLRPLQRGRWEPTTRVEQDEALRATRTPVGPATEHIRCFGDSVEVTAWGPGAEWLLEHAPELVGVKDHASRFAPTHPGLRELRRRHPGLRMARSRAVTEFIVPTILEQKVTGAGARRSYRALVRAYGEPAPGPFELLLPPDPKVIASLPYQDFHPFGVERRRAATVKVACSYAHRLEETCDLDPQSAWKRLLALPGVGPWTTALVAKTAWGDPDAVEVGDLHVPVLVCWFLAGESGGTDERMLELLEPYRGQRARVISLIEASGLRPPRRAPRMEVADFASF